MEKYGDQIANTLSTIGAEAKLLGPDEYGAYLKTQVQLFSAGLKTLNSN